jgi:hypothetical protein
MGMSPEMLQQLQAQMGGQQPQAPQDSSQQFDPNQPMTGGHPMAAQMSPPQMNPDAVPSVDPMEMLGEVIMKYMNFATSLIDDKSLDKPIQSKILAEQANAISTLVSALQSNNQQSAEQQQMEMQLKAQQHDQEMQMKHEAHQTAIQQQQEKHAMDIQKMQNDMQVAGVQMIGKQAEQQQKLQHTEEAHSQKLVHEKKAAESKVQMQKQAAQSKPTSKPSNKGAKK